MDIWSKENLRREILLTAALQETEIQEFARLSHSSLHSGIRNSKSSPTVLLRRPDNQNAAHCSAKYNNSARCSLCRYASCCCGIINKQLLIPRITVKPLSVHCLYDRTVPNV